MKNLVGGYHSTNYLSSFKPRSNFPVQWINIALISVFIVLLLYRFLPSPTELDPLQLDQSIYNFSYPLQVNMHEVIRRIRADISISITPINKPNFDWQHLNANKCRQHKEKYGHVPEILLLVRSAPENFDRREAIRHTWGAENCWSEFKMVRVFLIGTRPRSQVPSARLNEEIELYDDIIQQEFEDNYRNLTYKMMQGISWAVNHCSSASMLLTVDDDVFVHPRNVISYLELLSLSERETLYGGFVYHKSTPFRKSNHSFGEQWLVTKEEYPYDFYPPYVVGAVTFLAMPLAKDVNIVMQFMRFLRFDDIFLAIGMHKLGYTPTDIPGVSSYFGFDSSHPNLDKVLLTDHKIPNGRMQWVYWRKINGKTLCTRG